MEIKKSIENIKIENIKNEAKKYYKGKNMLPRYIFLGFLLIIIILQFVLPKPKLEFLNKQNDSQNTGFQTQNTTNIVFLGKNINLFDSNNIFFQDKLNFSLAQIKDNPNTTKYLIDHKTKILKYLDKELDKNGLPTDLKYLAMLGTRRPLPSSLEVEKYFGLQIDSEIDERLDYKKMTNLLIQYSKILYKDFEDRDLVLIAYLFGTEDLKTLMMTQNQIELDKLYLPTNISKMYFDIIAYKQILENLEYKTKNLAKISTIKLGETEDLINRASKNNYNYKEIKELNPWILGNSLPKGKRELEVFKK